MCTASTTGSSDTRVAGPSRTTSGSRESGRAGSWSLVQLGEPERSLFGLFAKVGERHFERGRAGDQDHVISYSHPGQRRIRVEHDSARQLAQPAPRAVAIDRALERPADGDAHAAVL